MANETRAKVRHHTARSGLSSSSGKAVAVRVSTGVRAQPQVPARRPQRCQVDDDVPCDVQKLSDSSDSSDSSFDAPMHGTGTGTGTGRMDGAPSSWRDRLAPCLS